MTKIFSVFDSKAKAYLTPIFCRNAEVAIRMFATAARDESHDFAKYAEDYTLFEIGEWDEDSGVVQPLMAHVRLMAAHECVQGPGPDTD